MSNRRPRRSSDLGSALTLGGNVPPVIGLLLLLILLASVVAWLAQAKMLGALIPEAIYPGLQLWRLVSWAFVQGDPLTLLFGGFTLFSFGGQLVYVMGERRLLWTFLLLAVAGSVFASALARVWGPANVAHLGMWPVVNGLILIWSIHYPFQQVSLFFGALPMNGRTMGLLVVFGTVLFGIAGGGLPGLGAMAPHFGALAAAWVLARGRVRVPWRRWSLGVREWWNERAFKRRSRHLKVVKKNGSSDPPRWMN